MRFSWNDRNIWIIIVLPLYVNNSSIEEDPYNILENLCNRMDSFVLKHSRSSDRTFYYRKIAPPNTRISNSKKWGSNFTGSSLYYISIPKLCSKCTQKFRYFVHKIALIIAPIYVWCVFEQNQAIHINFHKNPSSIFGSFSCWTYHLCFAHLEWFLN